MDRLKMGFVVAALLLAACAGTDAWLVHRYQEVDRNVSHLRSELVQADSTTASLNRQMTELAAQVGAGASSSDLSNLSSQVSTLSSQVSNLQAAVGITPVNGGDLSSAVSQLDQEVECLDQNFQTIGTALLNDSSLSPEDIQECVP